MDKKIIKCETKYADGYVDIDSLPEELDLKEKNYSNFLFGKGKIDFKRKKRDDR